MNVLIERLDGELMVQVIRFTTALRDGLGLFLAGAGAMDVLFLNSFQHIKHLFLILKCVNECSRHDIVVNL